MQQTSCPSHEMPMLYPSPDACCGCGACVARCHQGALSLVEDKYGFVYPSFNESLCIGCGCCEKACGFQRNRYSASKGPWFAAADSGDFSDSASGGAFYSIARSVIHAGGVVYGAAYELRDDGLHVCHRRVHDMVGLRSLQGSKYVQSSTVDVFRKVRADLKDGLTVLFSGTPCQVAGLHGFLGVDWPNLITVDLVCHGVPSERMFRSYIEGLEKHHNRRLIDFVFRCKRYGWGRFFLLLRLRPFERIDDSLDQEELINAKDSSYYSLFLKLKVMRDSCYHCPFAGSHRPGDLTVGDFWGVEQNRPDFISSGKFDVKSGISCVLINTTHGLEAFRQYGSKLKSETVSFEDIAKGNEQLCHPSALPFDRHLYLEAFREKGWEGVDWLWSRREHGLLSKIKKAVGAVLPKSFVCALVDAIRRGRLGK